MKIQILLFCHFYSARLIAEWTGQAEDNKFTEG